jgi:glycosyltransferase involved in cell wall biosynthesis
MVRTWIYVPDGQVGWLPYAVRAGRREIAARGIDVIYSTSFPVTSHVAAYLLKRKTGIPWIADFRDLWTENHYREPSSGLRKRLDRAIETRLVEAADVLVTVSETWAETLRDASGGRKRVEVIRNGFDAADFEGIDRRRPDKWTITYAGSFYGAKQDPSAFLAALRRLIDCGKIPRDAVRFTIVGEPDPFVQRQLERFSLDDVTQWTGFVPHSTSLGHQVRSSLLLLIVHAHGANSGLIPGKLYEYLGSRRPILAIVPHDFEAARIVRESLAGTTLEATDDEGIERCLADSYAAYAAGIEAASAAADLSAYERRHGAKALADLMAELAGRAETAVAPSGRDARVLPH